jgi:hypothetical protein
VEGERHEFLPPKPPGPEPELGQRPAAEPRPPAPAPAWQPPAQSSPPPQGAAAPGWGSGPARVEPDNGPAVAGFVLSLVGGGLLIVSAGLSSVISVGCSIFGIVYSLKGKRKVEAGETTRNRGLAQAGFVIGIVSLVLAVIATIVWIIVVVALATDDDFRRDFEDELDDDNTITAAVRVVSAAARLLVA